MKCNKCGFENDSNSKFCLNCGNELEKNETKAKKISKDKNKKEETVQKVDNTNTIDAVKGSSVQNISSENKKKKVLPFVLIGVGVIVLAIIIFLVLKLIGGKSKTSSINELYGNDNLIRITDNGKYGYIDLKGNVVIEPTLEYATKYTNGYAVISGEEIDEITGKEIDIYKVIDKDGKVVATAKYSYLIDYIDEGDTVLWVVNNVLYDSNFKQISSDTMEVAYEDEGYFSFIDDTKKTGGIINKDGKVTYTYEFDSYEDYFSITPSETDLDEKYCQVNIDNEKYGIVNCDTGKIIYDFSDLYISVKDDNTFKIQKHDSYEFVSLVYIQGDKILYESNDSSADISYYSSGDYVRVSEKDPNGKYSSSKKYSYIDVKTGKISDEVPKNNSDSIDLDIFEELTGYTKFSCDSGYGIMEGDNVILKCEWKAIYYLDNTLYEYLKSKGKNYVIGKRDGNYYLVSLNSNDIKVEFNTDSLNYSSSLFVKYVDKDSSELVVYNLVNDKSMSFDKNDNITLNSNYFTASDTDTIKYYNSEFKLIYTSNK